MAEEGGGSVEAEAAMAAELLMTTSEGERERELLIIQTSLDRYSSL